MEMFIVLGEKDPAILFWQALLRENIRGGIFKKCRLCDYTAAPLPKNSMIQFVKKLMKLKKIKAIIATIF